MSYFLFASESYETKLKTKIAPFRSLQQKL